MRFIFIFLAFFFMNLSLGQVVKEKRYTTIGGKKKWLSKIERFDKQGNIFEKVYINKKDGRESYLETYAYDSLGHLIEIFSYSFSDEGLRLIEFHTTYTYDENGYLIFLTDLENDMEGKISEKCSVNYYHKVAYTNDSYGNILTSKLLPSCQDSLLFMVYNTYAYSGTGRLTQSSAFSTSDPKKIRSQSRFFYDNKDSLIRTEDYDIAGDTLRLASVLQFKYDAKGKMTWFENNARTGDNYLTIRYTYNKRGQLIEENKYRQDKPVELITYRYRKNNLTRINSTLFSNGTISSKSSEKIKYVYF